MNKNNKFRYASDKTVKEKLEIWFIKDHKKGLIRKNSNIS